MLCRDMVYPAAGYLHLSAASKTPLLLLLQSYCMLETNRHLLWDDLHEALVFLHQASKGMDTKDPDHVKHLQDVLLELYYLQRNHRVSLQQKCNHPKSLVILDQLLLLVACPSNTTYL